MSQTDLEITGLRFRQKLDVPRMGYIWTVAFVFIDGSSSPQFNIDWRGGPADEWKLIPCNPLEQLAETASVSGGGFMDIKTEPFASFQDQKNRIQEEVAFEKGAAAALKNLIKTLLASRSDGDGYE